MRVYVAASCRRKNEAQMVADQLSLTGRHLPVSNWHLPSRPPDDDPARWLDESEMDYRDIQRCDAVVCLTGDKDSKGGRHTEFGIGIGLGKHLIILGMPEQVFHHFRGVQHAPDVGCVIDILDTLKEYQNENPRN